MIICDKNFCTGCEACRNICTQNAISFVQSEKGFFYPQIDLLKCIQCNLCKKFCPVNNPPKKNKYKQVYAALAKNDLLRAESTSGGLFVCLAQMIIKKDGYVYGAALCEDLVVRHIEAHSVDEIKKLRKSKYVQSSIGLCYQMIEKRLKEGRQVLFSGTPCQVAGLKNYLNKKYSNLLTVDILCHGVPSPGMLRKYIVYEESKSNSQMVNIAFRSKNVGWKKNKTERYFINGQKADWPDTFVPGFLKNFYLRESCYDCQYASDQRQGDISLGDYWGYIETRPEYIEDDDKGISLVIINTDKGEKAFKSIKHKIAFAPRTMESAKQGNAVLYKPCEKPDCYEDFWKDSAKMSWGDLQNKYIPEQDAEEWMSKEMREYYNIPFVKRHRRHKIHMIYNSVIRKMKGLFQ